MQVPFFLPSGYGVAEGNGAKAPSPMKGLLSGAKRQPRSITRRFEKKGAAPRDLWKIAGLRTQPCYASKIDATAKIPDAIRLLGFFVPIFKVQF